MLTYTHPLAPVCTMPHQVGAPVPTVARQGRQNQRYGENGERLVAGCALNTNAVGFHMISRLVIVAFPPLGFPPLLLFFL